MSKRVLIVDDEENLRHILSIILTKEGYEVEAVKNGREALNCLEKSIYDTVLCDIRMPVMDGITFLKAVQSSEFGVRSKTPETQNSKLKTLSLPTIIMMSAYGAIDDAIEAMKLGAYDYISKPFKSDEVILTIRKAEERERLRRENSELREVVKKDFGVTGIITKNEEMVKMLATVKKVADYKTTVLITGESGTGKELIARALHYNGGRGSKAFVAVNCGAIPENLLESEFFGHVKGAFTDAVRNKKGLFEEAEGGTLFLDEIGELPFHLQVKLLRALQEEEIMRIGDTKPIRVSVRIVAATVKDLGREVKEGRFREDLFYRLNVLPIHLPPLRERPEDIPALSSHFMGKYKDRHGIKVGAVSPDAMKLLMDYTWPGNVRELENAIERSVLLSEGENITVSALPPAVRGKMVSASPGTGLKTGIPSDNLSIKKAARAMEEELIKRALEKSHGNRTHAAELLELSHRALLYKIKEYGIKG
ncbi:MAG: sigma-54-dependent Fis family transcriptional regulator [Deltaproteobacteria bacterium]|nr:sigma-54-dependent Fis family transcriptional regulator [Deltaproteobacteria bacterium]